MKKNQIMSPIEDNEDNEYGNKVKKNLLRMLKEKEKEEEEQQEREREKRRLRLTPKNNRPK